MSMAIITNNVPAPIDRRDVPPHLAERLYREVQNTRATNAAPAADPIPYMVVNTLQVAGIATEGKSDVQLLDDYLRLLRASATTLAANADRTRATDEFAGYDINSLIDASSPQKAANSGADYDLNNP